jgi:murein peptide amidase A
VSFAAFVAAMAMSVVGHSVEGRTIEAHRDGDPSAGRVMLVVGSIHGNERAGERVVREFRRRFGDRLRRVGVWTIESVNPDGVAARTRGNAHGVDLNRNFAESWEPIPRGSGYYSGPKPFSEPETRAMRVFLRRVRPDVTVWYHQPFGRTLIPCDRRGRRVALRYARLSGLPPDDCFPSPPGSATAWQDAALKAKAFVAEFPARGVTAAEARRHARALYEIAIPGTR